MSRILGLFVGAALMAHRAPMAAQEPVPKKVMDLGPMSDVWRVFDSPNGRYYISDENGSTRIIGAKGNVIAKLSDATAVSVTARGDVVEFARSTAADPEHQYVWTARLDTATGRLAGEPHRISIKPANAAAISPDGKSVLVTRHESDGWSIGVMPANGGDERRIWHRPGRPFSPEWSSDGKWIYYTYENPAGAPRIERVPASGKTAPDSVTTAGRFLGFSRDGKYFAVSRTRPLVAIHRADGTFLRTVQIWGHVPSWSHAQPHSLVSGVNDAPTMLKSISFPDGAITDLPKVTGNDDWPRFTPDGRHLVFVGHTDGRSELEIADRDGSHRRSYGLSGRAADPLISPDSRYMAYTEHTPAIYVVDLASGKERRLVTPDPVGTMTWRGDSRAVRYLSLITPSNRQIRDATLAQSDSLVRDIGGYAAGRPVYVAADSMLLTYDDAGLHSMNLRSGAATTIVTGKVRGGSIGARTPLSRDGKWIGFELDDPASGIGSINMVGVDGLHKQQIGQPLKCGGNIVGWHPNGRDVFFYGYAQCDSLENMNVYAASRDGGPMRNLTAMERPGTVEEVAVHPDGRQIVYSVDGINRGSIQFMDLSKILP